MRKADLHVHTTASDGKHSPERMVEYAVKAGLDTIAITDHNTIAGCADAIEAGAVKGLHVITGIEVTTNTGHVIGLDIEELIPRGRSWRWTLDAIHEQGGIAVAVHPFSTRPPGICYTGLAGKLLSFDAVEVVNVGGLVLGARAQGKALKHWMTHMGNYAALCNTDAHTGQQLGKGFTYYRDDVLEDILNKKTGLGIL